MSDTARIIMPSQAQRNPRSLQSIQRKPPASDFLPQVKDEIVYRFKRRGQEPRAIAGELTRHSGVRVQVRHINEVLRAAIPDGPRPPAPGNVIPIRKWAA